MSGGLDIIRPRVGVTILAWSPLAEPKGTMAGFCDVHIPPFRLRLFGVTVHVKNDKRWAALPSRPWVGKDGGLVKDEATGKVKYQPVVGFDSDQMRWRFSDAVIEGLSHYAPGWDR